MLSAGKDFTNTGTVTGPMVGIFADGKVTNQSTISATDFLSLTGDSITNTAGSKLQSGGWLSLTAQNDIRNQQGLIEGNDVSLVSREGSIINRTEYTVFTSPNGRTTSTHVGAASTIVSHNSLRLDAGQDLDLQGSQFKAAQDITLKAGNDIKLDAIEITSSSDTSTRKVTNRTSETRHQVVSIDAGNQLTLDAGRDLNAEGTQFKAGGDASLNAGRDVNLSAVANTTHSESLAKRKKVIDTETTHTLVDLQSGGNVSLKAGQDANLIGTNVNAEGNVSLAAERDLNLSAVVDSDYHYDYTKKKKSMGRSKTTENETLEQTVTGGVINAGGNILVNAVEQQDGSVAVLDSRNVKIAGAVLTAGGDALIGAKGDVTLTAIAEDSIDYHRKSKSGVGGLTGKSKSETHLRTNQIGSLVSADGDAVVMAGKDTNLEASTVYAGESAELHAGLVDENGDINITSLQNLSFDESKTRKKSFSLDVSKDFVSFSKETRTTNDKTLVTNAGSQVLAGDNITGKAARDITVQGSVLDAGNNVDLTAGRDVKLLAGTDTSTQGEERSNRRDGIGWGGDDNGFSVFAGNETRKNREQNGENLAAATEINAGNNVKVKAGQDVLVAGSDINAGKSITLDATRDVTVTTSTDTLETEQKESFTRDGLTVTANHNIGQAVDALKNLGSGDNAVSDASGVMRAADAMNKVGPSGSAFLGQTTTTNTGKSNIENARGSNLTAGEDVVIIAGNNATVAGSQVNAQRNISIDANDINLVAAENTRSNTTKTDYQQIGVTLQATQGNASLTAGFSKADSKLVEKDITTSGTGLNAGQDVSLIARNDINIVGSEINAKRDITLDAGNDVNITSGQGYTTSQFDSDYQSAGAGINFGTKGIGFTAYVALGENELDRKNINNTNSHITAGQNLKITSGNDTTIKGGNLQANDVNLDVGNNLTIASVQDTGEVKGKRWDVSGSITVGAGFSGGASVGYGETEGSSAWVAEQTSVIGSNSVIINTKNHTQIDAALVANIKDDGSDGGNLNLSTKTLGFSDLEDHHEETSTYLAVGFSTGGTSGANNNTGASPDSKGSSYSFDAQYSDLDRKQVTRATIGNGTVTVRDDQTTGSDSTAGLNRNIDDAQEITKDKSNNIDVYYSSTAVDSLKGLATTDNPNTQGVDEGEQNTLNVWKNNVTSVADPKAWEAIADNANEVASIEALKKSLQSAQYTIQSLGTNLDQSFNEALGQTGERMVNQLMRHGMSEADANQFLKDNPQLVVVGTQLQSVRDALANPQQYALDQQGEQLQNQLNAKFDQNQQNAADPESYEVTVIGVAAPTTPVETAAMALGDGKRYMDDLRAENPTAARMAEIAISGAMGGPVKALVMVPVNQGIDMAVDKLAGQQIQDATDIATNFIGKTITDVDESYDDFADLASSNTFDDRQARIKDGSEFILGTVLGIGGGKGESNTTLGMNGNNQAAPNTSANVSGGNAGNNNNTNTPTDSTTNNVVNVNAGSKNNWDKAINGQLDPQTTYQLNNGHAYKTDSQGRVAEVEADLSRTTMDRNGYQQCTTGKCGNPGDEGGHLIASSLGGAGDKINIVPQSQLLNRGDWKAMENSFRDVLKDGGTVSVKIEVGYPPVGGARPSSFIVVANVNGVVKEYEFDQ